MFIEAEEQNIGKYVDVSNITDAVVDDPQAEPSKVSDQALSKDSLEAIDLTTLSYDISVDNDPSVQPMCELTLEEDPDSEEIIDYSEQREAIESFMEYGYLPEPLYTNLVENYPAEFAVLNKYLTAYSLVKGRYSFLGLPGKIAKESIHEVNDAMQDDYILNLLAHPEEIDIEEMRERFITIEKFFESEEFDTFYLEDTTE